MAMKLSVVAHPKSKHPRIETRAGILHVYVAEPPVDNKANAAVRAALAKHFHLSQARIKILAGIKSKNKRFSMDL